MDIGRSPITTAILLVLRRVDLQDSHGCLATIHGIYLARAVPRATRSEDHPLRGSRRTSTWKIRARCCLKSMDTGSSSYLAEISRATKGCRIRLFSLASCTILSPSSPPHRTPSFHRNGLRGEWRSSAENSIKGVLTFHAGCARAQPALPHLP